MNSLLGTRNYKIILLYPTRHTITSLSIGIVIKRLKNLERNVGQYNFWSKIFFQVALGYIVTLRRIINVQ